MTTIDFLFSLDHAGERLRELSEPLRFAIYDAEEGMIDDAVSRILGEPEIVGNEKCPVMFRWTIAEPFGCKVLLHHFLPNGDDPDPHDHPRSFVTLVLAGGYLDESWRLHGIDLRRIVEEPMTRGRVRCRGARHLHRTRVGPQGCWSLVVMGPLRRPWGFLWDGNWWPWKTYLDERGETALRCPE